LFTGIYIALYHLAHGAVLIPEAVCCNFNFAVKRCCWIV